MTKEAYSFIIKEETRKEPDHMIIFAVSPATLQAAFVAQKSPLYEVHYTDLYDIKDFIKRIPNRHYIKGLLVDHPVALVLRRSKRYGKAQRATKNEDGI